MSRTQTESPAAWPARDILWLGYFGSGTPEGRRYRNRSICALALFVVGGILFAVLDPIVPVRVLLAMLPGLVFGYIAWEWWRYVNHLDELARRLQVEAMAWTYIVGIFAAMTLTGVCFAMNWSFNPAIFILLEVVRASRLWVLVRKF